MSKMQEDWRYHSDHRHHTMTCSVRGCYQPVAKTTFSTLCTGHKERRRRVGHPTGKSVGWTQFDRYRRVYAHPFLDRYEGIHEGVANAIPVLDRLLAEAKMPESYGRHLSDLQKTEYWLALLHRRGVTGREILSGLIGMDVLRELDNSLFKSDMHHRIQTATRLMGLGVRGRVGIKGHLQASMTGLRMRELLLKRIMKPLGPMVLNATRRITETWRNYHDLEASVLGVDRPFE